MPEDSRNSRLETLLQRARWTIGVERYWPQAVWAAGVVLVFLGVSWLGLWLVVPVWARIAGVLGFGLLLLGPPLLSLRLGLATRADALRRLDRDSGLRHRPVSASQDRLADPEADPMTRALWALHQRKQLDALAAVRLAPPSPRVVDRDRYAVRSAVLVAAIAAAAAAGTERGGRLASAFDWHRAEPASAAFRLDAWIDPPPYTGRAPVLLSGLPQGAEATPISAPVGSSVVVRWAGSGTVTVKAEGGLGPVAAPEKPGVVAGSTQQGSDRPAGADQTFRLTADGHLAVDRDDRQVVRFDLRAIPDLAPTVTILDKPKSNLRGSLTLKYKVQDDYGIVSADGSFSQPVLAGKPVTGRTLAEAPKLPLALPNGARGLGQGQTTADLSEHPWAGADVTLIVSAKDEAGNTGSSAPMTIRLPSRSFKKPLARALVEQRRSLVFDPDHHERVDVALDALSDAPDLFGTTPAVFLGLQAAERRLVAAKTDADLLGVADLLWSMAVTIEDGDLSQTERDLRALQRQLKDAIARNAPPEEIKKLTEALKEQLDKFLSEMAKNNADQDQSQSDRGGKSVTPKDLQSLLDRMEQSARNGDMAEAQQLLEQLQSILENLKSARRGSQQGGDRQMEQSMGNLDRMMRDQQALRDKTFRRGGQQRSGQRGQPRDPQDLSGEDPQAGDPSDGAEQQGANSDLQQQQQQLRQKLDELQKQMRDMGMNGEKGFGEAEQAMKDAEQALGEGRRGNDRAVEAQGRALQGLQQGARGLQKQMADGQGDGEGQQPGQNAMGRANGTADGDGTDPLGRERNNRERGIDAQGGLNAGDGLAERARQVLEELRRRLGDRLRPQEEQDYLERLLKRY